MGKRPRPGACFGTKPASCTRAIRPSNDLSGVGSLRSCLTAALCVSGLPAGPPKRARELWPRSVDAWAGQATLRRGGKRGKDALRMRDEPAGRIGAPGPLQHARNKGHAVSILLLLLARAACTCAHDQRFWPPKNGAATLPWALPLAQRLEISPPTTRIWRSSPPSAIPRTNAARSAGAGGIEWGTPSVTDLHLLLPAREGVGRSHPRSRLQICSGEDYWHQAQGGRVPTALGSVERGPGICKPGTDSYASDARHDLGSQSSAVRLGSWVNGCGAGNGACLADKTESIR